MLGAKGTPFDIFGTGSSDKPAGGGITDEQLAALLAGGGGGYGPPSGWQTVVVGNRQIVYDPVSGKEVDTSSVPGGGAGAAPERITYDIAARPIPGFPGWVSIHDAATGEYLGMKEMPPEAATGLVAEKLPGAEGYLVLKDQSGKVIGQLDDPTYVSATDQSLIEQRKQQSLNDKAQTLIGMFNTMINAGTLDDNKAINAFNSEMRKYEAELDAQYKQFSMNQTSWQDEETARFNRENAGVNQQISLAGEATDRGRILAQDVLPRYLSGPLNIPGMGQINVQASNPNDFFNALGAPNLGDITPISANPFAAPPAVPTLPTAPNASYTPTPAPAFDLTKVMALLGA